MAKFDIARILWKNVKNLLKTFSNCSNKLIMIIQKVFAPQEKYQDISFHKDLVSIQIVCHMDFTIG